ncbi:MAG: hypothetical protein WBB94_01180 [Candidatus Saccharimonadaceae bacterium]
MASSIDLTTVKRTRYASIAAVLAAASTLETDGRLWAAVRVSSGGAYVFIEIVKDDGECRLVPCRDHFRDDFDSWLRRLGIDASQLTVRVIAGQLTLIAPNRDRRTLGETTLGWYIVEESEIRYFNPRN